MRPRASGWGTTGVRFSFTRTDLDTAAWLPGYVTVGQGSERLPCGEMYHLFKIEQTSQWEITWLTFPFAAFSTSNATSSYPVEVARNALPAIQTHGRSSATAGDPGFLYRRPHSSTER